MLDITRLIRKLPRKHREPSGNCGVFANAMCRFLEEKGYACELILIGDSEEGDYEEDNLYHVCFSVNQVCYDGSGKIDNLETFAKEFSETHYDDAKPFIHHRPSNEKNQAHVRQNTDYSVYEETIFNKIVMSYSDIE